MDKKQLFELTVLFLFAFLIMGIWPIFVLWAVSVVFGVATSLTWKSWIAVQILLSVSGFTGRQLRFTQTYTAGN